MGEVSAKENPDLAFKMHMLLSRLDPEMSDRWHWRDTRKVLRNLEIIKEQGIPASKAIRNAFVAFTPRPYVCLCPMLTYLNLPITPSYDVLLFWLHADKDVLEPRLDERVDEMLEVSAFVISSYESPELSMSVWAHSRSSYSQGIDEYKCWYNSLTQFVMPKS